MTRRIDNMLASYLVETAELHAKLEDSLRHMRWAILHGENVAAETRTSRAHCKRLILALERVELYLQEDAKREPDKATIRAVK